MHGFAQLGNSRLGEYSRAVARAAVPISFIRSHDCPDVLPLPLHAVTAFAAALPNVQDTPEPAVVIDLVVGVVLALDFLFRVGWAKRSISPALGSEQSSF